MDTKNLYNKIENHVTKLFEKIPHSSLIFHNILHTQNVVKHTKEISGYYKISDAEMLILFAAAWFHDCGHLYTTPEKHEYKSCEIMKEYMRGIINDELIITEIDHCIMATKFPTSPGNLLQQIICDADTYHFGTKEFEITNGKVFKELQLRGYKIDMRKFNEGTIRMFLNHHFYTDYCRNLLEKGKEKNLKQLQSIC